METSGSRVGSSQSGIGSLYDHYARRWFIKLAKRMEVKVNEVIENEGEPQDWSRFYTEKTGNLGLHISVHVSKRDGDIVYRVHLRINRYKYEKWAKEHLYLMESLLTFRIGPVIFAHPGRDVATITRAGKEWLKPINIWEMECGFMTREGNQFFNLLRNTVVVEVRRNEFASEEDTAAWVVKRLK